MREVTQKEIFDCLFWKIDGEGADYAIEDYSSWSEIKDEKFHDLRNKYIEAKKVLIEYIESKINE